MRWSRRRVLRVDGRSDAAPCIFFARGSRPRLPGARAGAPSSTELSLGYFVENRDGVDQVLQQAVAAGSEW